LSAERIVVGDDPRVHTASLAEAFHQMAEQAPAAGRVLVVAAGAGVTAGAALYLVPPRS
jgi:3-oxoacyl-[acyl-carrier-protein] synthase-3